MTFIDGHCRAWNGEFAFTKEEIDAKIPAGAKGLYCILYSPTIGGTQQRVYIGKAVAGDSSISSRLRSHWSGRGNWAFQRPWDASRFTFCFIVCDEATASSIEAATILLESPVFNVRNEWKYLMDPDFGVPITNITVH